MVSRLILAILVSLVILSHDSHDCGEYSDNCESADSDNNSDSGNADDSGDSVEYHGE